MPLHPLEIEHIRLEKHIATRRQQCREAYAQQQYDEFHRLCGDIESAGLLLLRCKEQLDELKLTVTT